MNEMMNSMAEVAEVKADMNLPASIEGFKNPAALDIYCSVKDITSVDSQIKLYNAINSPEKKIDECINMTIVVKDVIAHPVEILDEKTGELLSLVRTILIDDKGVCYEAVSVGVKNSLQWIFAICGQPTTWKEPIKVKPVQRKTRNGDNKVTLLELVK